MSKNALVLKGTNFSANKLTTVELVTEEIPCTAISLSESSKTVTSVTPFTLTATVTPANTTDEVEWSTSDSSVATVADGVVTIVGVGTATITVTCGQQTANCSVDASEIVVDADYGFFNCGQNDTTFLRSYDGLGYFTIYNLSLYGTMRGFRVGDGHNGCPIPLLNNVSSIVVTAKDTYADPVYVFFCDTDQAASESRDECCLLVSLDNSKNGVVTNAFTYEYAVPSGVNAVAVRFRMRTQATSSDEPDTYATNHEVALKFKAATT